MATTSSESDDLVEQMLLHLKEKEAEPAMVAAESSAPEIQELELAQAPVQQQQEFGSVLDNTPAPFAKEEPPSLSTGSPSTQEREEPSIISVPISNELAQAY